MKVATILCASLLTAAVFAEEPAIADFRNFEAKNCKTFQNGKVEKRRPASGSRRSEPGG